MVASESEAPASLGGHPVVRAQVLGTFRVTVDGTSVERADWQRVAAERLVKLLLVTDGHAMPRDLAIETLWPEADPDSGYNSFRKALHFARRALGAPGALRCDRDNLRLEPARLELDLDRLRTAFELLRRRRGSRPAASEPGDPAAADLAEVERAAVATVLDLGTRPLLPDDAYEDWLVGPREQLLSRWQVVAMDAASAAAADGRKGEAHGILEQILDRDPTDEAAHRLIIELYASEGRHHSARRQFELCRQALATVEAEPSVDTEAAYRRAAIAATATGAPGPRARLIARRHELSVVEPLLDRLAAGRSAALIVHGPAGIGKTRLLDEVRELGHGAGWRELSWQAIESSRPFAFAPFALRLGGLVTREQVEAWDEPERSATATILPGLGVQPHLDFADRSAFVVALVAALVRVSRDCPLVIAIDDLLWLDEASTVLLAAAAAAFPDVPLMVVVTHRDEEPMPAPGVALLDALRRTGAVDLLLAPLAERDMEPLVLAHLGGQSVAPDLVAWLYAQSEGNPLFCVAAARDSAERGAIRRDNERWHIAGAELFREPPRAVRTLVAARIRSLDPAASRLLETAAELGPIVGYDTLATVLPDIEGGLIAALDAALASGLLVERGGGYAFAHPLFRAAVVSDSGIARRAVLHLAVARAMAGPPTATGADWQADSVALARASPDPGPAAEHALTAYDLGLREAGPLAVALGFAAGLRARQLFDRDAATALLERSTAIWSRLPRSVASRFDAANAFVNLAELRMAALDEAGADAAFRTALDAARTPEELASVYEHLTFLRYRHGEFAATLSLCDEALARIPPEAAAARAVINGRISLILGRLHRLDEAVKHAEDAVADLEAADDRAQLCFALDILGVSLSGVGRTAEGLAASERALAIALELREPRLEIVRAHVAEILKTAGRPAEARPHAQRSLELAEQMGEWYFAAVSAWLAADVEDALGDYEAAVRLRQRELALLARIGGNRHNEARAHAHLAHLARLTGDVTTEVVEADLARRLAAEDADPAYTALIENALTVERWSDVSEF